MKKLLVSKYLLTELASGECPFTLQGVNIDKLMAHERDSKSYKAKIAGTDKWVKVLKKDNKHAKLPVLKRGESAEV